MRVRVNRIEDADLNLFHFDFDLTLMMFFLNAEEEIYSRYGGRDSEGPDERQSLSGLRYTMQSVLATHRDREKRFAPRPAERSFYIRELGTRRRGGRCMHCHQVKEGIHDRLMDDGGWNLDLVFRYPPPDNLGLKMEVDRGNIVEKVTRGSPAAGVGLQAGDVVRLLNGFPVHSFGDAQYALDRAPERGTVSVSWRRGDETMSGKMELPEDWRRTDISWRPSLYSFLASARVYGDDLEAGEKTALGLSPERLVFRQQERVHDQARAAGIRPGDLILGFDDRELEMEVYEFLTYVRSNYVAGEVVTVSVIRDGKRLRLPMTLR